MNYRNIFLILLIITFIATLFVSVKKPKMHKVALIYNSDYIIKQVETPQKEETSIPTVVQEQQVSTSQKKVQNTVQKQTVPKKVEVKTVKKENTKPQNNVVVKTARNEVDKKQTQAKTTVQVPKKVEQVKVVNVPKNTEVKKTQEVKIPEKTVKVETHQKPQTLTKEQEEIAWNVWRSNIQNQIMKDTNLPIVPNGTVFRFVFDVDKYGKISNIQTYSDNKAYTPYAIQYIAPVIRNYQGKSILNFPQGTARITTTVKGAWKISNNTRYSTPKDYNDTEVIQR